MAYFLGIKKDNQLIPIRISDPSGNINNSILDLVDFTAQFSNDFELADHLQEEGIIEDYDGPFYYLIDKGQKGHKTYNIVPGTEGVIFESDKDNFSPTKIRKKIHNKALDSEFIGHLYAFYLRKVGVYNQTVNYFSSLGSRPNELMGAIRAILKYPLSDAAREYLKEIVNFIDKAEDLGYHKFFNSSNGDKYYALLDKADKYFGTTDIDVIFVSKALSGKAKNSGISILSYLSNMFALSYRNQSAPLYHRELEDLDYNIDQFVSFTIYNYDKKNSSFRMVNGKKKLQERNLFDLGVFLTEYELYECYLAYRDAMPVSTTEEFDDDHEEFLEEEDFTRINTTSEEQGFRLRKTDNQRYSE